MLNNDRLASPNLSAIGTPGITNGTTANNILTTDREL